MRLEFYADLPIYITSRKRNGCDEYVIINRNVPGGWSDSELRENGLLIEFYTTEVDDAIDLFMLSVEAYITDKKKSMPALYANLEAHVFLGKPTELRRSFSDEEFSDDLMQILYTRHEPTWKRAEPGSCALRGAAVTTQPGSESLPGCSDAPTAACTPRKVRPVPRCALTRLACDRGTGCARGAPAL